MFGKKSTEALVVGAGPAGMIAALTFARNGIDTMIVDAAERSCTRSNALLLHPGTLKLFDRLGFSERVIEAGYRIDKVMVYDDTQPRETVRMNELPLSFPFAVALPQWELEAILESELRDEGVKVLWNHRVSELENREHGARAAIDRYSERGMGYAISHTDKVIDKTLKVDAPFVVAADGYNSQMRRLAGVELESLAPDQYYAFFEFETDMDPEHAVRVSLKNGLATAQYPMVGGTARLSFEYTGLDVPEENRDKEREPVQEDYDHKRLDDAHLKELIDQRVPWAEGYINRIRYRALAPFQKRYLPQPFTGRVFFLGDAARHFGPLSMTGMNLGIQEAEQLASAYTKDSRDDDAFRSLSGLGHSLASQWKAIANLEKHSMPIERADPWVAENRARILRSLPATGEALERLGAQLFLHIKLGELVNA